MIADRNAFERKTAKKLAKYTCEKNLFLRKNKNAKHFHFRRIFLKFWYNCCLCPSVLSLKKLNGLRAKNHDPVPTLISFHKALYFLTKLPKQSNVELEPGHDFLPEARPEPLFNTTRYV